MFVNKVAPDVSFIPLKWWKIKSRRSGAGYVDRFDLLSDIGGRTLRTHPASASGIDTAS